MLTIKKALQLKEDFIKKSWYLPSNEDLKHLKMLSNSILLLERYENRKKLENYLTITLTNLKLILSEKKRTNKVLFSSNETVSQFIELTNKEKSVIKEQIKLIEFILK